MSACPACGGRLDAPFHVVDEVPANSCLLLESADEARTFPTGRLELALCGDCGFIANTAFDPALTEYSGRYEETQAFSPRFVDFGRELAKTWVERHGLHDGGVVEIGCGKGEFLVWMVEAGVGEGLGIDPGVHPERLSGDIAEKVALVADLYGPDYAGIHADAFVCRHTLEHIAPVADFLATLRSNIGDDHDTVVLFELPDTLRVLEEAAFWDTYHEHCSYFTPGSLVRLFTASGFDVDRVELAFDDQYVLLEARPSRTATGQDRTGLADDRDRIRAGVEHFRQQVGDTLDDWRSRIAAVQARGGRTVLWGGGSKAVAFLTSTGLGEEVTGAVDINPHKQGRHIAGTGHRVLAPEELVELQPELVIVMNPIYLDEIRRDLEGLGLAHARLEAV